MALAELLRLLPLLLAEADFVATAWLLLGFALLAFAALPADFLLVDFFAATRPFLLAALAADARADVLGLLFAVVFLLLVLFARLVAAFLVVARATVRFLVDFFVALFLAVLLFEALLRAAAFLAIARLLGGELSLSMGYVRPVVSLRGGGCFFSIIFPVSLEMSRVSSPACPPPHVEASSVPAHMDLAATNAQAILRRCFVEKWRVFTLSTLLAVAIAGCSVAFAWLSGQLIVAITEAGRDRWIMLGAMLFGAALVRGVLQYFRTWISEALVQRLSHELRGELFSRVLHATHSLDSDELAQRLGPDVQRSEAMLHIGLANLPLQVLTGLAVGGYAFVLDWPAALMASGTATVLLLAIAALTRRNRQVHRAAWDRQAELSTLTAGTARGADVIRSYSATEWAEARFRSASDQAMAAMMQAARLRGLTGPLVTIGAVLAALAVLFAVGSRFEAGHLTPAEAGSIAIALLLFLRPIQSGAMSAPTLSAGLAALDRLSAVLEQGVRMGPSAAEPHRAGGQLELRDGFVATTDGTPILSGANVSVKPRQSIAIVGPSGAGKTTLLRALSQQVELASGGLYFEGEPLDHPGGLFSIVPERPVLFRTTLAENVTLGAPLEEGRLHRALAEVGLSTRIDALEHGVQTVLEKSGGEFSAGERQRLCIARALYRSAPFLMLDEPTAHLDPQAAEGLVLTLQVLLSGRTVVLVTHDERLARAAEYVIVVEHGRLVAQGPGSEVRQGAAFQRVFQEADLAHKSVVRALT